MHHLAFFNMYDCSGACRRLVDSLTAMTKWQRIAGVLESYGSMVYFIGHMYKSTGRSKHILLTVDQLSEKPAVFMMFSNTNRAECKAELYDTHKNSTQ